VLGIVKRSEEDLVGWLSTEIGFLTAFGRYDDKPITLEPYQLAFLSVGYTREVMHRGTKRPFASRDSQQNNRRAPQTWIRQALERSFAGLDSE